MRSGGLLHGELLAALARVGHGDVVVIADAGLRIPASTPTIDLGLVPGVPDLVEVLNAVSEAMVVESAIVASEWVDWNPARRAEVCGVLGVPVEERPHEELMADMRESAAVYVRTAECSAFASVCLVAGVSYFDDAVALRDRSAAN